MSGDPATVETARRGDEAGFLELAAEVEHWFGPMVNEPGFHHALETGITRCRALLIRRNDKPLAGLLFSGRSRLYHIDWLVVSESARGLGLGRQLVTAALRRFTSPPATVEVVTFGSDHPAARDGGARIFYERLGFEPGPMEPNGPEGGSRQLYRRFLPAVMPGQQGMAPP